MGGSSSTRRVEVEAGDLQGTVKVSEAVAKRLIGHPDASFEGKSGATRMTPQVKGRRGFTENEYEYSNEDMERIEKMYKERIKQLELKNSELYQTTSDQFAKAVEEVEEKFLKTTANPICQDLQNEVMHCYKDHPKETLRCSEQVKAFTECVRKSREKLLTSKG